MNICLLFVCMTVLPAIVGRGVLAVCYGGRTSKLYMADYMITGWLVTIGLVEGAHLAAAFLGWNLTKTVWAWVAVVLFLALACGVVIFSFAPKGKNVKKGTFRLQFRDAGQIWLCIGFLILFTWQIMTIVSQEGLYRTGDMTAETVVSFLETDGVYMVNPLTGRAYESGIPMRIRILCLPTFYSALCRVFGIGGTVLVWQIVPVMVLCLSYAVFWLLGKSLFRDSGESNSILIFMFLTAVVFCAGEYAWGMDGFGLLHCGFQGVTVRNTVLVPYLFSLLLRKKWCPILLVVFVEACITWTFYGMGVCLAIVAVWSVLSFLDKRRASGLCSVREEA